MKSIDMDFSENEIGELETFFVESDNPKAGGSFYPTVVESDYNDQSNVEFELSESSINDTVGEFEKLSLINFKSDSKRSDIDSDRFKDTFIRRTIAINTYQDNAESKAIELYNARSSIAHGSPLRKGISFDAVLFTATTVILAIQLFSTFKSKGIDEVGFDKTLPQYIEEFGQG